MPPPSLFHVAPKVDLQIEPERAGFRYRMKDVHAEVRFGRSAGELEIVNLEGREGFKIQLRARNERPWR